MLVPLLLSGGAAPLSHPPVVLITQALSFLTHIPNAIIMGLATVTQQHPEMLWKNIKPQAPLGIYVSREGLRNLNF